MPLRTLVVGSDPQLLQKLIPVFELAGIETDVCTAPADARQRLAQTKYEAVLVDCAGLAGAVDVLLDVHRLGSNRSSVTFAVVSEITTPKEAAALGASFVLERSFTQDWLFRSLRAAHGLMLVEKRRYYRHPLDVVVWVTRTDGKGGELPATTLDLSQGGIGFRMVAPPPLKTEVDLRYDLPGAGTVHARGEIAWVKPDEGTVGVQFTRLSRQARAQVVDWLVQQMDKAEPPSPPIPASMSAAGRQEPTSGRRLLCHAFANNLPVAWKCGQCAWRHTIRLDETRWRYVNDPPEAVVRDFEQHDCAAHPANS